MPVVGSSAYNTAGQITSLVRALLNDAQGNLFTDAVLLPYANSAYRAVQRAYLGEELPPVERAPTVGQHTDEVLREVLGYDDERIAGLRSSGALG